MTEDRNNTRGHCPAKLPLALLLMPYALLRYALDVRSARRKARS